MANSNRKRESKQRPGLFRALGKSSPPSSIEIAQRSYRMIKTYKHDSWAATALFESCDDGPRNKVVCKFNRVQPIGPIPMAWLGRRLADREFAMYDLLADLPEIATAYRVVRADGRQLINACAHDFIEGHPLRWHDLVNDDFFDKLDRRLVEMHRRSVAYVDMNKAENVIVNIYGDPCLIDFQISQRWPSLWLRAPLRILQRSDLYHSFKLRRRFRPDLLTRQQETKAIPWWIRAHRLIANPFRACRRKLLVGLRIRHGKGMPQGEVFVEDALKADGSRGDSVDQNKPILKLYRLLRCPEYVERFQSGQQYVNQLFTDLLSGAPLQKVDRKLAKKIRDASDHNKVVEMLKCKTFFVLSGRWDNKWIESKTRSIMQALDGADSANLPLSVSKRNAA